jgi:hypothetical protein
MISKILAGGSIRQLMFETSGQLAGNIKIKGSLCVKSFHQLLSAVKLTPQHG